MKRYDQVQDQIRRLKRERWLRILSTESPGHAPGRRPRDPDQERLLLRLDRARLSRRDAAGEIRISKIEPDE